jgi:hypothetical protein
MEISFCGTYVIRQSLWNIFSIWLGFERKSVCAIKKKNIYYSVSCLNFLKVKPRTFRIDFLNNVFSHPFIKIAYAIDPYNKLVVWRKDARDQADCGCPLSYAIWVVVRDLKSWYIIFYAKTSVSVSWLEWWRVPHAITDTIRLFVTIIISVKHQFL